MSSMKLAYELDGWRLLGHEMVIRQNADGQWLVQPDFTGSASDQWLTKHGLDTARSQTRRALIEWISQAHHSDACPYVPEPADGVKLQRIGKDDNHVIYTDEHDLFDIYRDVDMWTGAFVWKVTTHFDDFGEAWDTEVLTLRHARAHIMDFYNQCSEEGTTPEQFAVDALSATEIALASS